MTATATIAEGASRTSPPRRKRLSAADRGQQLVSIAAALFVEHGYENVSLEDVARAAGISRPIVYEHHGSKEGLLLACCRRARADFERRLTEALAIDPGADLPARVRRGGAVFFDLLEHDPHGWSLLFGTTLARTGALAEGLDALRRGTITRIADVLRLHAPCGDALTIEAFAHAISGVGEQLGRWWLANPQIGKATVLDHYVDFVSGGLRSLIGARGAVSVDTSRVQNRKQ